MAATRNLASQIGLLMALTMIGANDCSAAAAETSLKASPPEDFADLEAPRDVMVDVYYGGHRLGVARATTSPGSLRFQDPGEVAGLLAPFADSPQISLALQTQLPSNAGRACSRMLSVDCGRLQSGAVGIIYDEDHFRVDIFLSDDLVGKPLTTEVYLTPTSQEFAAVGTIGAAMSGTSATDQTYNMQGRAIVSLGSSRLKTNLSYSSEFGALADDMLVELDQPNRRYMGGLFWTPGTSLVGRRRILGVGTATQYDTRVDRDQLEGTPLPVFVQQRSIVELLIDGRLVSSRVVEPGNQLLDTTGLPEGTYPIVLRIREPGGETREERRFFTKDERLAPPGEVRYQAFAGVIAPSREDHLVSLTDSFFYQVGAAKRLSEHSGVDATVLGTQQKVIGEASAMLLTKIARLRVTALASTKGEFGAVAQLSSLSAGRLQYSFDLRRVWDPDGGGLLPGSFHGVGFDTEQSNWSADQGGNYTQVNATVGYALGDASLRLFASYIDTEDAKPDYSIGPTVDWLVAQGGGLQLRLEADAQKSRASTSAYVGVRFLFSNNGFASSGTAGFRTRDDQHGGAVSKSVASLNTEWSGIRENFGRYSVGGGVERAIEGEMARARGSIDSRYGNLRADLMHNFDRQTQYSLSLQTGAAVGPRASIGGYNISESALIVEVQGSGATGQFEVLVDETPAATVSAGQRTTLFLQPYREYAVRLRPMSAASVQYDASLRKVTLFPGNVDRLSFKAIETFTVFGQLVDPAGSPIRNGLLQGAHGTGSSDGDGYFQIDIAAGDQVTLNSTWGQSCQFALKKIVPKQGYSSVGRIVCQ